MKQQPKIMRLDIEEEEPNQEVGADQEEEQMSVSQPPGKALLGRKNLCLGGTTGATSDDEYNAEKNNLSDEAPTMNA